MSATSYILLLTLFLTEGGTLEAEQEIDASSLQECRVEAKRQQDALLREPFRDVKIRCERRKGSQ